MYATRFAACLLGGAIGDALGAAVEFMPRREILRRFGPDGIRAYAPAYGRVGAITDDTQMTLFTAEGLLCAAAQGHEPGHPAYVQETAQAYLRWLLTQEGDPGAHAGAEGLLGVPELHSPRAPGNTCLSALEALHEHQSDASIPLPLAQEKRDALSPTPLPLAGEGAPQGRVRAGAASKGRARDLPSTLRATNHSKGCGGVMRVAPAGLLLARQVDDPDTAARLAFTLGTDVAAITHGHPSGYLPAGAFAAILALRVKGVDLPSAIERSRALLVTETGYEETLSALDAAVRAAATHPADAATLAQLGGGWTGEEALAIALYCALSEPRFDESLVLAVNHDGDSDSTGAITGNLLGLDALDPGVPQPWLAELELAALTRAMGERLAAVTGANAG